MSGARTRDLARAGSAEVYELYRSGGIVSTEIYAFLSRDLPAWIEYARCARAQAHTEAGSALPAWECPAQETDRWVTRAR